MKCPECGYDITGGRHKCLRCGYEVRSLKIITEEEIKKQQESEEYKEEYVDIDPDNVYFGGVEDQGEDFGGGVFGDLFGSIFGSSGGFGGQSRRSSGVFGSLEDILGGFFDTYDEDDDEESDFMEELEYKTDPFGNRIKRNNKTVVLGSKDVDEYDEEGNLKNGKKTKKDKRKDKKGEQQ